VIDVTIQINGYHVSLQTHMVQFSWKPIFQRQTRMLWWLGLKMYCERRL
jgi:hypothetical protein